MRRPGSAHPELQRRRLSLISIFKGSIPLSVRADTAASIYLKHPVGLFPEDILHEIAAFMAPCDILNFSLTCSVARRWLAPALYEYVACKSSKRCTKTLSMLSAHPEICGHIKSLSLHPNYYLAWPKPDKSLKETGVALTISNVVENLNFEALHTFDWGGLEMPMETMWSTLHKNCPNLRNIHTKVGARPLSPESELFKFSQLRSFSLSILYRLNEETGPFIQSEPLPSPLWDMLIHRCPDLEELRICSSTSPCFFDFLPITTARWPKLHFLSLGSFGYQMDFTLGAVEDSTFFEFLEYHSALKDLRFQWNLRWMLSPIVLRLTLSPDALPRLETFSGIYQQLAKLPSRSLNSIKTLDLTCELFPAHRFSVLSDLLQKMPSLSTFDFWSHLTEPPVGAFLPFGALFLACKRLTDFHFMCTIPFPTKLLEKLASDLSQLPELKRFGLTKGYSYRDESMLEDALLILRANPSLQEITLRWARESSHNHLKQAGVYEITSQDGMPEYIMVHEQGIPLFGPPFERRYKYYLKPRTLIDTLKQHRTLQLLHNR